MATSNDLETLFANIRPHQARSVSNIGQNTEQTAARSHGFNFPSHPPQLSDPQRHGSPTVNGSQAQSSFSSNSNFGGSQEKDERTSSLLNLLKFSQPNPSNSNPLPNPPPLRSISYQGHENTSNEPQNIHAGGISASDLVASFMGKPSPPTQGVKSPAPATSGDSRKASAQEDPQDILLRLLNRQKEAPKMDTQSQENKLPEGRGSEAFADDLKQDVADATTQNAHSAPNYSNRASPSPRVFGSERQPSSFDPAVSIERERTPSKPVFTYVNPFDQLAASSPRNRTPKLEATSGRGSPAVELLKRENDGSKRKSQESSPEPSLRRKLTPVGVKNRQSPGPGNFAPQTESVSNALGEVAGQVDKQVEDALARAEEEGDTTIKHEETSTRSSMDDLADKLQDAAIEIKKELESEENKGALEDILPAEDAAAIKGIIDDAANRELLDNNWESADGEESPTKEDEDAGRVVKVFQFPIKPFVAISIKNLPGPEAEFRDDGIIDIARFKKSFDQTDRCLTSATAEYIVYSQVKAGGVRVIRQEDGIDRSLFKASNDRVFNVSVPTTPYKTVSNSQAVLATGVSGTVYWAPIFQAQNDMFENNTMESEGLVFPPSGAADDPSSTSGGQLKTRARKSSRHPEYFAIGRGKSIHVVFTLPAAAPKYRKETGHHNGLGVVDTEQFFKDRNLKITTGKAGKDFSFSEDDTVIVSLDKNGMVKFWDVRDLVEGPNPTASRVEPVNISTPIMMLASAATSREKPWPTSVMLLDKLRPYTRGTALRYMIVGLKQNHTMQLWDLALGKPVQELNFPHSDDADAICSFGYDPNTGILAVGHPTRNSIFFVHLSAPRYSLKPMCQADLLQRIVNKDPRLPATESTAFLSGIREISFAPKGQLRNLELLAATRPKAPSSAETEGVQESGVLFELYVMHSRGVTCMRIQNEDLGWSDDNKVLKGIDAEEANVIELADLRNFPDESVSGTETPTPAKVTGRDKKKSSEEIVIAPAPVESSEPGATTMAKQLDVSHDAVPTSSSPDKSEKKKKHRNKPSKAGPKSSDLSDTQSTSRSLPSSHIQPPISETISSQPVPTEPTKIAADPTDLDSSKSIDPSVDMDPTKSPFLPITPTKSGRSGADENINIGISTEFLNKEIKKIERGVSTEMGRVLHHELDMLHRRLTEDKRVEETREGVRTETVLRLVSTALNENVEKSLGRIITDNMQRSVIPALQTVTKQVIEHHVTRVIERRLTDTIAQNLGAWMNREMQTHFPNAVAQAMQNQDALRMMTDGIANKVAARLNTENTKHAAQIADLNAKLEQLTTLMRGSVDAVTTMAAAQSQFQEEVLKLQRQIGEGTNDTDPEENQLTPLAVSSRENASRDTTSREDTQSPTIRSQQPAKSPEEIELAEITELMTEGSYQDGSIKVRDHPNLSCTLR
jgi:hypothetical protein